MNRLLPLLIFLSGYHSYAQKPLQRFTIQGRVMDSVSHAPVGYTTITLLDAGTGKALRTSFTNSEGNFSLAVPQTAAPAAFSASPYLLTLTHVGYLPKTLNASTPEYHAKILDLGSIMLAPLSDKLAAVTVTGAKPLMKQEIDRISYDVQADPESKSNDALEMLRKVPLVTVDGNEQIQLKGGTSFQIFVNGKPSPLMANDPSDVLKSMPAAAIQRIEVITVPPAKYDAEGLTGIINIITVKKNLAETTGSLFARVNSIDGERGSASFAIKKGKIGLNSFFGLGHRTLRDYAASSQLTNLSSSTTLVQQGYNLLGGNFYNGHTDLGFEVDSLNLVTASIDFYGRRFTQNTYRATQNTTMPDSLTQAYQLDNLGDLKIGSFVFETSYQLGFKRSKNESLTLSYQYAYTENNQVNSVSATDRFNYNDSDYEQQNFTNTRQHTLQLDFSKPVQKLMIECGLKTIFEDITSNFGDESLDPATHQYITNTLSGNSFRETQNIFAAYNSYQLKLTDWTFKAGLRLENTVLGGASLAGADSLNKNYADLIPVLSIQRSYRNAGSFTLGFTDRIERPTARQLNPFVDRSNPSFIVTGNPALQPIVNHIFELSYSHFGKVSLNTGVNYSFSSHTIQNVTSAISDTISESTYQNVGNNQTAGLNLTTDLPLTQKMELNLNGQLSHVWITGLYEGQSYKNDGNQDNLGVFLRYHFPQDLTVTGYFDYFCGNVYLQGKTNSYIYYSIQAIKDLFKKRATISFTVYDPFMRYSNAWTYTSAPDFVQTSHFQYYGRAFRLGINYKLGRPGANAHASRAGVQHEDNPGSPGSDNQ